ncbi:hypothetical protein Pelo_17462 [Pelomyxa schiedti]|nr:hypothetical protein Pelo_17462 [Pelomyxa schiedti]
MCVWRTTDNGAMDMATVDCKLLKDIQTLRFFAGSEYDSESDILEVFSTEVRDRQLFLRGFHLDLNTVWKEGAVTEPKCVAECNMTNAGVSPEDLCTPLLDRVEKKYYLPFMTTSQYTEKQNLLDLLTGMTITWLEDSTGLLQVKAVDESHLGVTQEDHCSTSVYSISSICNPKPASGPAPKRPRTTESSWHHTHHLIPCYTHLHPPGTQSVVAGSGLLVCSSTVSSIAGNKGLCLPGGTLYKNRFGLAYQNSTALLATRHTFVDAFTGSTLFSITHSLGISTIWNSTIAVPSVNTCIPQSASSWTSNRKETNFFLLFDDERRPCAPVSDCFVEGEGPGLVAVDDDTPSLLSSATTSAATA